ncbi:hypothetical protein ANO14919_068290 [Xylariales sp. No.14919]|nr:hypothetical protein ANO14919_068290 [Xylariales sp. No.14919]
MAIFMFVLAFFLRDGLAAAVTSLEADILDADGNTGVLQTQLAPSWATTSNVRSTSNLLWTSLLTLSLCVYTVIHVNIPPPGSKKWRLYGRKALWVLAAILTPDFAVYTAYEQLETARQLKRELQKHAASHKGEGLTAPEHVSRFGLTYSFYAVMGGFRVDVSSIHDELESMAITPAGLQYLARHGHFIDLPKSAIQDKSKADNLAKVIVCLQVAWLIVQCIGRKVNDLPIALLELHVLAHVVSALFLYAIWFRKPLNVEESTMVDSKEFDDIIALFLLGTTGELGVCVRTASRTDTHTETLDSDSIAMHSLGECNRHSCVTEPASYKLEPGRPLEHGLGLEQTATAITLSAKGLERWRRADRAPHGHTINPPFDQYLTKHSKEMGSISFQASLSSGFRLFFRRATPKGANRRELQLYIALSFLAALYAGIHLAAWNYHFATGVEMWLWRVSGLIVAAILPITGIALSFFILLSNIVAVSFGVDIFDPLLKVGRVFVTIIVPVIHLSARLLLAVEAFISVRQMPIGVFVTIPWSNYIPHL